MIGHMRQISTNPQMHFLSYIRPSKRKAETQGFRSCYFVAFISLFACIDFIFYTTACQQPVFLQKNDTGSKHSRKNVQNLYRCYFEALFYETDRTIGCITT